MSKRAHLGRTLFILSSAVWLPALPFVQIASCYLRLRVFTFMTMYILAHSHTCIPKYSLALLPANLDTMYAPIFLHFAFSFVPCIFVPFRVHYFEFEFFVAIGNRNLDYCSSLTLGLDLVIVPLEVRHLVCTSSRP